MISIVAEIGINHNGDLDIAKKLIDYASLTGFDFVKFQKRTPELCVPEHQKNEMRETPWGRMTYLEYKNRIEFDRNDYITISKYCDKRKINWFASVWDLPSARFMTEFSPMVKIPSAKITDLMLIEYCRKNFEHVQISTGMSTEEEVQEAFLMGRPEVLYHTNSTYPSPIVELNLNYIKWLQDRYSDTEIGYSGHEWGLTTTFAVVSMGITWIERHIILDHDMWGTDQKASVDPVGMIKLIRGIRDIERAMGNGGARIPTPSEKIKMDKLR